MRWYRVTVVTAVRWTACWVVMYLAAGVEGTNSRSICQ
jgi:hypothetical protein